MLNFFVRSANRKFIMKGVITIAFFTCTPSMSMATPTEARLTAVEDCRFLGKVEGKSGYGKNAGWPPLAKASALRRAEKIGASHVVWERMVPVGAFNGIIIARSYSCGN